VPRAPEERAANTGERLSRAGSQGQMDWALLECLLLSRAGEVVSGASGTVPRNTGNTGHRELRSGSGSRRVRMRADVYGRDRRGSERSGDERRGRSRGERGAKSSHRALLTTYSVIGTRISETWGSTACY
jgi:hypothetical protein